MESENSINKENTSVALSGMILSFIGVICACIPNWRTIGGGIFFVALIVSIFALNRLSKRGEKKVRATIGIILSILGITLAGYFLFMEKSTMQDETSPVPAELQQGNAQEADDENALEKLQGLTDSSTTQKE